MATNMAVMMTEKILVLARKDQHTLGAVRGIPALQAGVWEDHIWLRGIPVNGKTDLRIQQLPALQTWWLGQEGLLFAAGQLVPASKLPDLQWLPLKTFLPVSLPVSAMPGRLLHPQEAQLVPSSVEQPIVALLTTLEIWKAYAADVPAIRLQPLYFAVSGKEDVLVMGNPLATIPGKAYFLRDQILLPAGYDFDPPILSVLIKEKLALQDKGYLLFDLAAHHQLIPLEGFVPATRSGIRMTHVK
jgi:hypothetical protein